MTDRSQLLNKARSNKLVSSNSLIFRNTCFAWYTIHFQSAEGGKVIPHLWLVFSKSALDLSRVPRSTLTLMRLRCCRRTEIIVFRFARKSSNKLYRFCAQVEYAFCYVVLFTFHRMLDVLKYIVLQVTAIRLCIVCFVSWLQLPELTVLNFINA